MARKIETEQDKKRKKIRIIIIVFLVVLIIALSVFLVIHFKKPKPEAKNPIEVTILTNLEKYGYTLKDTDSAYYKSEFESLENLLKGDTIDLKEYATKVARLFTIDLYSLSTKVNKYDIGGVEFCYKSKKEEYENKVMDTLYETLQDNTFGDRNQVLPEVKEVETISVEETKYKLGDKVVDGYLVKLKMTYVSDLKYDDEASVVVCKEEDSERWSVVEFQPTLNPEYDQK